MKLATLVVLLTCLAAIGLASARSPKNRHYKKNKLNSDLLLAAERGNVTEVRRLINEGADANSTQRRNGKTALMLAAAENRRDVVTFLLDEAKVDINAGDRLRQDAVKAAIDKQRDEMVELLLQRGANPSRVDRSGLSLLMHATRARNFMAFKLLLDHGANIYYRRAGGKSVAAIAADKVQNDIRFLDVLLQKDETLVYEKDNQGRSLMHVAASRCNGEIVKLLVQKGAARDLLQEAICTITVQKNVTLVESLLDSGLNVNAVDVFSKSKTLLIYAVDANLTAVVRLLIQKGANLELKDLQHGQTAFLHAVEHRHIEIAELLVISGANVKAVDKKGRDALAFSRNIKRQVDRVKIQRLINNPSGAVRNN